MTSNVTPPEEVVVLDTTTPEGPNETLGPPKKPRKPRPPKVVTKLAAVSETSPTTQEAPKELPLEFWAGLMQTQRVLMAQKETERYNSFRIV